MRISKMLYVYIREERGYVCLWHRKNEKLKLFEENSSN